MTDPLKEKSKAFQDLYKKFECNHENSELRLRTVDRGYTQRVQQCLRCGEPVSGAVSKEKAMKLCGGKEPPPFDNELMDGWKSSYQEQSDEITKNYETRSEYERAEFFKKYDVYLESDEWKEKREKVMERANHICEGCRTTEATQVHHLSYEHVGREFLFELVAICNECHNRIHEDNEE